MLRHRSSLKFSRRPFRRTERKFDAVAANADFKLLVSKIDAATDSNASMSRALFMEPSSSARGDVLPQYKLFPHARNQLPIVPTNTKGLVHPVLPTIMTARINSRHGTISNLELRNGADNSVEVAEILAEGCLYFSATLDGESGDTDYTNARRARARSAMNPYAPQAQVDSMLKSKILPPTEQGDCVSAMGEMPTHMTVTAYSAGCSDCEININITAFDTPAEWYKPETAWSSPKGVAPVAETTMLHSSSSEREMKISCQKHVKTALEALSPVVESLAKYLRTQVGSTVGDTHAAPPLDLQQQSSSERKVKGLRRAFWDKKQTSTSEIPTLVDVEKHPEETVPLSEEAVAILASGLLELQGTLLVGGLFADELQYQVNDVGYVGLFPQLAEVANEIGGPREALMGELQTPGKFRGVQSVVLSELLSKDPEAKVGPTYVTARAMLEDNTTLQPVSHWTLHGSKEVPPAVNLHVLRTLQRLSSEADYMGATTVRNAMFSECLKQAITVGFAHDRLCQRLLIAALIRVGLQCSSLAPLDTAEVDYAFAMTGREDEIPPRSDSTGSRQYPAYNKTLSQLSESPLFVTPRAKALWETIMSPKYTPPGSSLTTSRPLVPPPVLPPMPADHESSLFPSLRARPFPNAFANRTANMEAAKQFAMEAAKVEASLLPVGHLRGTRNQLSDESSQLGDSVMKAVATLETIEAADGLWEASTEASSLPLSLTSDSVPATLSSTAPWRWSTNTDSFATYANIMSRMDGLIVAMKVRSLEKDRQKRSGETPKSSSVRPVTDASGRFPDVDLADPQLLERAISKMATPSQVRRAVATALEHEMQRRVKGLEAISQEALHHEIQAVPTTDPQDTNTNNVNSQGSVNIPHYWPDFLRECFTPSELSSPLFNDIFSDRYTATDSSLLSEFRERVKDASSSTLGSNSALQLDTTHTEQEVTMEPSATKRENRGKDSLAPLLLFDRVYSAIAARLRK